MTSPFEETDFVDRDVEAGRAKRTSAAGSPPTVASPVTTRPLTREELEVKAGETQSRIAELKRAQEELERERAVLEEARRRRSEFEAGRSEMTTHLTRGIELLEKVEFTARRDAEQMAKTLAGFREALSKVQAINENAWTTENWSSELTRALTSIENARMEWNAARLKWTLLDGSAASDRHAAPPVPPGHPLTRLTDHAFGELCRVGLALTWPLALVALAGVVAFCLLLLRR
jgi:hypothetical protein